MLTKEQIDYLFDFCQANGVVCYDVQVELVDHLANAIEKEVAEHPDWSFQKALDVVFVSFGSQKFAPLVAEKYKAARLYCWRLFWSVFVKQIAWPGTWLGLAVFLYSYHALALHSSLAFFIMQMISVVPVMLGVKLGNMHLARMQEHMGKRFMLINMTWVQHLIPYGFMTIWMLHVLVCQILTYMSNSPHWGTEALSLPYQLIFGVLFYSHFLIGCAYFRTTGRLSAKIKKDFSSAAVR